MTDYTNRFKNKLKRIRGRILTDLFEQVLVGEHEDQILIYQEERLDYGMRGKNLTSYTKRVKN